MKKMKNWESYWKNLPIWNPELNKFGFKTRVVIIYNFSASDAICLPIFSKSKNYTPRYTEVDIGNNKIRISVKITIRIKPRYAGQLYWYCSRGAATYTAVPRL